MFNYDDEIQTILLDSKDESKGFIKAKSFNYAELAEATSGVGDHTVIKMIADNIKEVGGFTIRGNKPNVDEFLTWPNSLVTAITKKYFEAFGSKADPEVDPKVKEAKKK